MKSIGVIIIIFGLLVVGCGTQERAVTLKYKFDPGKKMSFAFNTTVVSKAYENDELVYADDTTYQMEYVQEVVEVLANNRAKCRFTYLDKQSGEQWVNEFIMAENGAITDILADSLDNESLEYFRKLFEQASPEYPSNPVKAGFEWNHDVKILLDAGPTEASTNYKLKSFVTESDMDCAVIEYSGTMLIPIGDNCPDENGLITTGNDKIATHGTLYFALEPGLIIKQDESSKLVRSGTVTENGIETAFLIEEDRTVSNHLIE